MSRGLTSAPANGDWGAAEPASSVPTFHGRPTMCSLAPASAFRRVCRYSSPVWAELVVRGRVFGPPDAAVLLDAGPEAEALAQQLVDSGAVPRAATDDAVHIAIAAANGVEFLVTWNFRHIANASMRARIEAVCREAGFEPPVICTPNELVEPQNAD